jgi:hypothetical protein
VAAIGNLSEQAGFALKKIVGFNEPISFFREIKKEFPISKM